jgi:hypothetical protein
MRRAGLVTILEIDWPTIIFLRSLVRFERAPKRIPRLFGSFASCLEGGNVYSFAEFTLLLEDSGLTNRTPYGSRS